ncbi:hypothetical protein [Cardiobacterium valvarum]|nr:hypothetical protein [Cardiobacterium valvarum]
MKNLIAPMLMLSAFTNVKANEVLSPLFNMPETDLEVRAFNKDMARYQTEKEILIADILKEDEEKERKKREAKEREERERQERERQAEEARRSEEEKRIEIEKEREIKRKQEVEERIRKEKEDEEARRQKYLKWQREKEEAWEREQAYIEEQVKRNRNNRYIHSSTPSSLTSSEIDNNDIDDEVNSNGYDPIWVLEANLNDIATSFKIPVDKAKAAQVFWKELPEDEPRNRIIKTSNGNYSLMVKGTDKTWTHQPNTGSPYDFVCNKQKAILLANKKEVLFSPVCAFYYGPTN